MGRFKVTVVGAGNVGATCAQRIADAELANVVMIDILEGIPQGKALDMLEACPISGADVSVIGTNDYKDTKDSDIVVITAGIARKPGMSRDDLLNINTGIVKQCAEKVKVGSPNAILILVSNPLDVMAYVAKVVTGFPKQRVMGMAGGESEVGEGSTVMAGWVGLRDTDFNHSVYGTAVVGTVEWVTRKGGN